jgi:hypothetical protein
VGTLAILALLMLGAGLVVVVAMPVAALAVSELAILCGEVVPAVVAGARRMSRAGQAVLRTAGRRAGAASRVAEVRR